MTPYVCKDPECTETFDWHLVNADPECLFENREAIAAFAQDLANDSHHAVLYVTVAGFEDQKIEIDLIPTSHIPHTTPDEVEEVAESEPSMGGHDAHS